MVMDNSSFHKDGIIRRLLKKLGCRLWNLLPNLNNIKQYWAKMKNFIVGTSKKQDGEMENLLLRVCNCVPI